MSTNALTTPTDDDNDDDDNKNIAMITETYRIINIELLPLSS